MDAYLTRRPRPLSVKAGFGHPVNDLHDPGCPQRPPWSLVNGGIPNVLLRGYNDFTSTYRIPLPANPPLINKPDGLSLSLSPEVYTGWFKHLGPRHRKSPTVSIDKQVQDTQWLLSHKNLSWGPITPLQRRHQLRLHGRRPTTASPCKPATTTTRPIDELGRITPK